MMYLLPCSLFPHSEILSLHYRYFNGKCSDEPHPIALPMFFTARTHHGLNHPYCLRILLLRIKLYSERFFLKTATLWNRLRCGCVLERYDNNILGQSVSILHSHIISLFLMLSVYHASRSIILYIEWGRQENWEVFNIDL